MTHRNEAGPPVVDVPRTANDLVAQVRVRLQADSHLHRQQSRLTLAQSGSTIVVSGRLQSFYLKQVLQEVIRRTPGVTYVVNQTEVAPHPK